MQESIRDWLVQAGFPEEIELAPLGGGFGSTTLWTFVPAPNAAPLLARVFREGGEWVADREYLAMRAAASHGIPVPTVVTRGVVSNRPLLVTTFVAGAPVSKAVIADRAQVHELGVRMGAALGRLHEVVAPEGLVTRADAWIDRGGPALAPIRRLLARIPNGDRLLHLDYHPDNVLVDGRTVTAIIDWENTIAGPPHIDLARTRAILHAAKVSGRLPEGQQGTVDRLVDGIVQGHAAVIGPDPHPELSAAWASAMTADDLVGHLGKPESWITEAFVERLRGERDRLIESIVRAHGS